MIILIHFFLLTSNEFRWFLFVCLFVCFLKKIIKYLAHLVGIHKDARFVAGAVDGVGVRSVGTRRGDRRSALAGTVSRGNRLDIVYSFCNFGRLLRHAAVDVHCVQGELACSVQ